MEIINLILIWMWMIILFIIIGLSSVSHIIKKQDTNIWKSFLFTEGKLIYLEKLLLKFSRLLIWNIVSMILILAIYLVDEEFLEQLINWLGVTFIPLAWERIMSFFGDKKKNKYYTYNFELFVLLLFISAFRISGKSVYDEPLYISCISMIVSCIFDILVQHCFSVLNNTRNKISMHKDLDYRTPRLTHISDAYTYIKELEILFEKYNSSFRKCNNIESISLNPTCKELGDEQRNNNVTSYIDEWYKSIVKIWNTYLIFNLLFILLSIYCLNYRIIVICILLLISLCLLFVFRKKDYYLFKRIIIRFFYEEWNYVVCYKCKEQIRLTYSSMIKLLRRNKYCKYVWSVLDFVAFFRYITFFDKINETKNIEIISENTRSLFNEYKTKQEKNVYYELPLWVCALFEYSLLNKCGAKDELKGLYYEYNNNQISTTLYSIWLHVTRNMSELNKGVVYDFMNYIRN